MGANPYSNEELDELRAKVTDWAVRIDNYETIARLISTIDTLRVNLAAQVGIKQKLHDEYVDARSLLQEHQDAHGFARDHADPWESTVSQWRIRRDSFLSRYP